MIPGNDPDQRVGQHRLPSVLFDTDRGMVFFLAFLVFTTFVVPPRWLFLKIETDAGITGWGEPVVEGRAETVAALVAELADYLIGKDPSAIEDHWTVLYRGGFYRGGAIHMSALAGVDQALWDIKGKALGVSVSDLLGG